MNILDLFFPDSLPLASARIFLKGCVNIIKETDSGFGHVIRVQIPALPFTSCVTLLNLSVFVGKVEVKIPEEE